MTNITRAKQHEEVLYGLLIWHNWLVSWGIVFKDSWVQILVGSLGYKANFSLTKGKSAPLV